MKRTVVLGKEHVAITLNEPGVLVVPVNVANSKRAKKENTSYARTQNLDGRRHSRFAKVGDNRNVE